MSRDSSTAEILVIPSRGSFSSFCISVASSRWICSPTRRVLGKSLGIGKKTVNRGGRAHFPFTETPCRLALQLAGHLDSLEDLYLVTGLDTVILDADAALGTRLDLSDIVLEAAQ